MPTIRPFRDYSEHDVINLFYVSGTYPIAKGTVVKVIGSGWAASNDSQQMLNGLGQSYADVVSQRWGVPSVCAVTQTSLYTDTALGMTLYDCKEVDENGLPLIYNPRKAAEMNIALSGQACPILTRGTILFSGVVGNAATGGTKAYLGPNGGVYTTGSTAIGQFLGNTDGNGYVLLRLDV